MRKRQREKILKRAGIKLRKGFPPAGLSTLEMSTCQRKAESNIAIAIYLSNEDVYGGLYGMDYINEFMKIVREVGSLENITGVKGSDNYARV